MCKCTPGIKTPWCGKPGCEMPPQVVSPAAVFANSWAGGAELPPGRRLRMLEFRADGDGLVVHAETEGGQIEIEPVTLSPDARWRERSLEYQRAFRAVLRRTGLLRD
jgi:hypothetical protein